MILTLEDYQKLNATQRTKVKRAELQQLLDEHIEADNANSIRGIIREELATIIAGVEKRIIDKYDKKIKDVEEENERLKKENTEIKAAISEQQKFLERIWSEKTATNIFISGIPNKMNIEGNDVNDPNIIVNHIKIRQPWSSTQWLQNFKKLGTKRRQRQTLNKNQLLICGGKKENILWLFEVQKSTCSVSY